MNNERQWREAERQWIETERQRIEAERHLPPETVQRQIEEALQASSLSRAQMDQIKRELEIVKREQEVYRRYRDLLEQALR